MTSNINEKESFLLYTSFNKLYFSQMTREEKGLILECIFDYVENGSYYSEEVEQDRCLKMALNSILDVIDRNTAKWEEARERRSQAAKARWSKNATKDSRTIETPNGTLLTMTGNIKNMPKDFDELKDSTGITNYEEVRHFVSFANYYNWETPISDMLKAYHDESVDTM